MHFSRGPAWRRTSRVRPALIATLIAIPLASGIAVGVIAANHSSTPQSQLHLSAQGLGIGQRLPLATGSATGTGVVLGQTPAQAADSMNCTIQVPANPLSAQGLATPYVLGDGCQMSNANLQAFVEADIINPRNGRIKVYNPLVITEGTQPAAPPIRPVLAPGDVVGIMFGFNGSKLLLTGTGNSLQQGKCVNGMGQSLFTQVAFCNSPAFFRAAHRDIARGLLRIPSLQNGADGKPCPTVRSFAVVDQDQSDNVVTTYLLTASGQTAQDSAANVTGLAGAAPIGNGSDNGLVNKFLDPALGCAPYQFRDKTAASGLSGSQITDELLAAADQAAPRALVPLNDPMTEVDGQQSVMKTNIFRIGVGQPLVNDRQAADTPANYCQNMMQAGMTQTALDTKPFSAFASPVPATGSNLFTFLAARLSASWVNLGCGALLNAPDPVTLTVDANGVATAASFSPLAVGTLPGGVAPSATPSGTPTATPSCAATPSPAPTPTAAAVATGTPTATASATASATATAGATASATPTAAPTPSCAATPIPSGSATPVPPARNPIPRRGWHNRIGHPHHM
ncbi:MAG: hypothetical protein QOG05_2461 [Streptosporangiaceae bacterium]|jgi:hypothetical protein|nr:hypothetical protein [Streptosporangiaceae bacterium]